MDSHFLFGEHLALINSEVSRPRVGVEVTSRHLLMVAIRNIIDRYKCNAISPSINDSWTELWQWPAMAMVRSKEES